MKMKQVALALSFVALVLVGLLYFLNAKSSPQKIQDACSCLYVIGGTKQECEKRIGLIFEVDDKNKVLRSQGLSSKLDTPQTGCTPAF
jgi:hypothetical protein